MAKFFISYSRQDGASIAQTIRKDISLLDSKHEVFRDMDDIAPGSDWEQTLQHQIEDCNYFLLLLTPASHQSMWIKKEIELVIKSECCTGIKKLFIYQIGHFALPDFIPHKFQVLLQSPNYTVDFYRLLSSMLRSPSFFNIHEELQNNKNYYDVELSVQADKVYLSLIDYVEYRFDHGFIQADLNYKRVVLKKDINDHFKIGFWTDQSVTIFIVIYLKNTKQVDIIHKVEIG